MFSIPKIEKEILDFWSKNGIFEKSVEQNKGKKNFVFFEGPPTANGKPGIHHVLARSFKDVVLRFRTMAGFFVPRWAGWDTHGLPVEIEVEKELGLKTKKDIERYGIAKFNQKAKESVWRYKNEWEEMTRRMGFWIDLSRPYITYENRYIETLWWIVKKIHEKGLLYQGHKVVPWCVRCGTTLSSHELALGYKEIEENSVYVKFKLKPGQKIGNFTTTDSTYILSWTTTPWTLPGNVALAVGENIGYIITGQGQDVVIVAQDRAEAVLGKEALQNRDFAVKGSDLVGLEYTPLFDIPSLKNDKAYKIYAADFVNTTEGTGVVHTAVMYGEDDYRLGIKAGLPQKHTVTEEGRFTNEVPDVGGMPVKTKESDEKIFAHLKRNNFLLKIDPYAHEYPFCWRCDTPLLYYARTSWFVSMQKLREKLLANNRNINWLPEHLKDGRFGEWLKEVKDWNFSRERYWGTPLPVWRCEKCGKTEVIGSRRELARKAGESKNRYLFLRHGEAESNAKNIVNSDPKDKDVYGLTDKGRKEAESAALKLKNEKIDLIFSSDFRRTRETAEYVANMLGKNVEYDERLREINTGIFNGKASQEYHAFFSDISEKFTKRPPEGESLSDVARRAFEFVNSIEAQHQEKTILIVSHEYPIWMFESVLQGWDIREALKEKEKRGDDFIATGNFREVPVVTGPRNENGFGDLHRPFVDALSWGCSCGGAVKRIPELADVWFDSGAMPFAQFHYPFENKEKIEGGLFKKPEFFPADYIVEGMDQTRGWFYTLLAVSTLLEKGAPYKNVISHGLVLDKNGQKMSKSKGNVVDPFMLFEKYGADVVRLYFYTVNQPADAKRFDETDLLKIQRNFFNLLINIFNFYQTYKPANIANSKPACLFAVRQDWTGRWQIANRTILDKWFEARMKDAERKVYGNLNAYQVVEAGRELFSLVEDFSRWYLRRSRRVFQRPENDQELAAASARLGTFLVRICTLLAPFAPFTSEYIYRAINNDLGFSEESVHLRAFEAPVKLSQNETVILRHMNAVRELASKILELRAARGIKVRQPLRRAKIRSTKSEIRDPEFLEVLKDEVNVKEIEFDQGIAENIWIDTEITPELKEEGIVRELIRRIQELRQEANLKPKQKALLVLNLEGEDRAIFEKNKETILKETSIERVEYGELSHISVI